MFLPLLLERQQPPRQLSLFHVRSDLNLDGIGLGSHIFTNVWPSPENLEWNSQPEKKRQTDRGKYLGEERRGEGEKKEKERERDRLTQWNRLANLEGEKTVRRREEDHEGRPSDVQHPFYFRQNFHVTQLENRREKEKEKTELTHACTQSKQRVPKRCLQDGIENGGKYSTTSKLRRVSRRHFQLLCSPSFARSFLSPLRSAHYYVRTCTAGRNGDEAVAYLVRKPDQVGETCQSRHLRSQHKGKSF